MTSKKTISILGAGKIGQALAKLWLCAGHSVCLGSRTPEKLAAIIETLGQQARAMSITEAAAQCELALLAVPYQAVDEVVATVSEQLAGKIVMDATNPFGFSAEMRVISTLSDHCTAGSRMAKLLPNSTVVRVFTYIPDELLVSRGTLQPGLWTVAMAGDDPAAKLLVAKLVGDAGFIPVDIGTLEESAPLDPGGILFRALLTEADTRAILTENKM